MATSYIEQRVCTRSLCRNVPENPRFKTCERCREKGREHKHQSRKRKAESDESNDMESLSKPPLKKLPLHLQEPTVFPSTSELLLSLKRQFQQHIRESAPLYFAGTSCIPKDKESHNKGCVQDMARTIWKTVGIRFTVQYHNQDQSTHTTRFYCSQDLAHAKPPRPVPDAPGLKHRQTLPMRRWDCGSKLIIRSREMKEGFQLTVRLTHNVPHLNDVGRHIPYHYIDLPDDVTENNREEVDSQFLPKKVK